jgi:hypothetical protein
VQRRGGGLGGGERVDAFERLVGQRQRGHPELPASAVLDRAAAARVRELTPRNAVEPGDRRPALGPEAVGAGERRRERLGAQVGGQLGVTRAAHEVAQQRRDVAAVELGERLGLLVERREQGLVASLDHAQGSGRSHTAS